MNAKEPIRFVIENGNDVTVYEDQAEFLDAILDLVSHNDLCTMESSRRNQAVYLKML